MRGILDDFEPGVEEGLGVDTTRLLRLEIEVAVHDERPRRHRPERRPVVVTLPHRKVHRLHHPSWRRRVVRERRQPGRLEEVPGEAAVELLQVGLRPREDVAEVEVLLLECGEAGPFALWQRLLDGLEENPLPDSFEITIDRRYADATRLDAMAKRFITFPGVEDISYGKQGVKTLSRLLRLLTYGGIAVAVLLSISVVFIVSNSVRLALYSRGMEIELMQWIGATKRFITGPFLMEGVLLGILGTGLAVGVLAGTYYALPKDLVLFMTGPKGMDFLPVEVIAYMTLGGLVLGFAGALVSVSKFLE